MTISDIKSQVKKCRTLFFEIIFFHWLALHGTRVPTNGSREFMKNKSVNFFDMVCEFGFSTILYNNGRRVHSINERIV
jgi:hypothetical protein